MKQTPGTIKPTFTEAQLARLTPAQRARLEEARARREEAQALEDQVYSEVVEDESPLADESLLEDVGDHVVEVRRVAFEVPKSEETISLDDLYKHLKWVGEEMRIQHRCVAFCQSSGCGKSRTVRELAQQFYVCYLPFPASATSTQWPPSSKLAERLLKALKEQQSAKSLTDIVKVLNAVLAALRSAIEVAGLSPAGWFDHIQTAELADQVDATMRSNLADTSTLEVESTLNCLRSERPDHPRQDVIIFAFDEASALLEPSRIEGFSLFRILRRACNENGVASIYLSTNSKVQNFYPAAHRDPSLRVSTMEDPVLPQPLTSFALPDCFLESRKLEVSLSVLDTPVWMSYYGRPLWQALVQAWSSTDKPKEFVAREILKVATQKLRLRERSSAVAVASLLCCLNVLPAVKLAETMVNSHMAQLLKVSTDRELLYTAYGSEPLLAWPAFGSFKSAPDVIIRATAEAIHNGCLAAGVVGEVFVRLALLLKRSRPSFEKLKVFQQAIFGGSDAPDDAFINFIQFVWAGEDVSEDLLWLAFERKAALIPRSPNQAGYDLVIPVWRGNPDQPLKSGQIGAVMIQVKNQRAAVSRLVLLCRLKDATSKLGFSLSFWAFQRTTSPKETDGKSELWECSLKHLSMGWERLSLLLDCKYEPAKPFEDEDLATYDWYGNLQEHSVCHNGRVIQLKTKPLLKRPLTPTESESKRRRT